MLMLLQPLGGSGRHISESEPSLVYVANNNSQRHRETLS